MPNEESIKALKQRIKECKKKALALRREGNDLHHPLTNVLRMHEVENLEREIESHLKTISVLEKIGNH